ncbi:hypothetical protein BDF22DRAFT_745025 [Syncephalis plumigaleata]|nr:hypothetical protein BDF22DRAFT_745025 [Syncephalis plumigaleata]
MSNERPDTRTPSPLSTFVDASDQPLTSSSSTATTTSSSSHHNHTTSSDSQKYEFVLYNEDDDDEDDDDRRAKSFTSAKEQLYSNSTNNSEINPTDISATESATNNTINTSNQPDALSSTTNNITDSICTNAPPQTLLDSQQQRLVTRELINREITQELVYLAANPSLQYLRRLPAGAVGTRISPSTFDPTPLLRYIYLRYVVSFPLFRDAGPSFWPRVQRFLDQLAARGIGNSRESGEKHKRQQMMKRLNRLLTLFFYSGTKLTEAPSIALLSEPDLVEGSHSAGKLPADNTTDTSTQQTENEEHADTHEHSLQSIDLSGEYREQDDATTTTTTATTANEDKPSEPSVGPPKGVNGINLNVVTVRPVQKSGKLRDTTHAEFILSVTFDNGNHLYVARRFHDLRRLHKQIRRAMPSLELPFPPPKTHNKAMQHEVFYREKDRLLMRAHLRRLVVIRPVAHSPIFHSFLTDEPIDLQGESLLDAECRAAREWQLYEESVRAQEESERLTKQYQADMANLRKEVLSSGGLQRLVDMLKHVDDVDKLPSYCQATFNYLCINFATSLYINFYSSDDSPAKLASLKRTNGMIPYRALRTVLKISNPARMAKGVTDLFLARPFGQRSVLQRIIATNVNETLKELDGDIERLEREIGDLAICHKINKYITHPKLQYPDDAEMSDDELLMRLLHDNSIAPELHAIQLERIWPVSNGHARPNRTLLGKLRKLLTLYLKKHDKETILSLIFEGSTSDLLKDIIAVVYGPLAEVYKAANIGDYIMDIAAFVDDLIHTVERMDEWRIHNDGRNPLEPFRALVNRYRGNMYQFLHRLYSRDRHGLFDNVLNWAETIMQFLQSGSGVIDLQAIASQVASSSGVDQTAALKEDLHQLAGYRHQVKERHRRKLQARLQTNVNDWTEQDVQDILDQLGVSADVEDVMGDEGDDDDDAMLLEWQRYMEEEANRLAGEGGEARQERDSESMSQQQQQETSMNRRVNAIVEPPIPLPQLKVIPEMVNPFIRELRTQLDEQLVETLARIATSSSSSSSSRGESHLSYVVT